LELFLLVEWQKKKKFSVSKMYSKSLRLAFTDRAQIKLALVQIEHLKG